MPETSFYAVSGIFYMLKFGGCWGMEKAREPLREQTGRRERNSVHRDKYIYWHTGEYIKILLCNKSIFLDDIYILRYNMTI